MTIAINNQLIHLKQHYVLDYNFWKKKENFVSISYCGTILRPEHNLLKSAQIVR